MKAKLIGCKVLMRELYSLCATSPNVVEIVWMEAALHEIPKNLRPALQAKIDEIEGKDDPGCEALLLGYGLCSLGTAGLVTKKLPLVVPRAHDCITLLLGSRARYQEYFQKYNGGAYWYSPGWIEQLKTAGMAGDEQARYLMYVEKYGEDNAQYLIETERGWTRGYQAAALIRWDSLFSPKYAEFTREAAVHNGLAYTEVPGEDAMLAKLVNGDWDEDFVVARPGQRLCYSGDEEIFRLEDTQGGQDA